MRRSAAAGALLTSRRRLTILRLPTRTAEKRRAGAPPVPRRRTQHRGRSRRLRARPRRPRATSCTPGTKLPPTPERKSGGGKHLRSLAAPSTTTPERGSRGPAKGRRRPPRLAGSAPKTPIYTPERRSGDSPSSRRRSGRRRMRNPPDTPAAAGRARVASGSPLEHCRWGTVPEISRVSSPPSYAFKLPKSLATQLRQMELLVARTSTVR
jgi:hypothetical protein